jgi:hypothetical protein
MASAGVKHKAAIAHGMSSRGMNDAEPAGQRGSIIGHRIVYRVVASQIGGAKIA